MRLLADENFNNAALRGLLRRLPSLDVVRVQDVGLSGVDDPGVLEWAAGDGRILLTHDGSTIPPFAFDRVSRGLPMPGVFVLPSTLDVGRMIDALEFVIGTSEQAEWADRVEYPERFLGSP